MYSTCFSSDVAGYCEWTLRFLLRIMLFCGAMVGREKEKTAGRAVSTGLLRGPLMRSSEGGFEIECFDL